MFLHVGLANGVLLRTEVSCLPACPACGPSAWAARCMQHSLSSWSEQALNCRAVMGLSCMQGAWQFAAH